MERSRRRSGRPIEDVPAARTPAARPQARALTADAVRSLQRTAGNAAVGRLFARRGGPVLAREPEIEATDAEMGQKVIDDLISINRQRDATSGIHYAEDYQKLAQTDDTARKFWKEDYWQGYADPAYWDRVGDMSWQLKAGANAAAAIRGWLTGVTIAECASALVAIELDTMRAAVGDERFNEMFSSLTQQPERGLLTLNKNRGTSSTKGFMIDTAEKAASQQGPEEVGRRTVAKGEWYYFYNHPKYRLKHPGGSFQGENCVCMDATPGAQKYSGFGVGILTEAEMLDEMARAYNADRTERDYELLVTTFGAEKAKAKQPTQTWKSLYDSMWWYEIPKENRAWVGFPDEVTASDIVKDPPTTIGTVTRKGGFQPGVGKKLDAAAVAQERDASVLVK